MKRIVRNILITLVAALFPALRGARLHPVDGLRAGTDRLDLPLAVARLHELVNEVRYVAAEGGPTLNAALATHDLVDELDLTVSPRFAGSTAPRMSVGGEPVDRRFELAHLLVDTDGFVFSRWVRRRAC